MKKLIIFEGIDQIGKSTFINSISDNILGSSIIKDDIQLNTSNPIKHYCANPHNFYENKHLGYMLGFINGLSYSSDNETYLCDRLHLTAFAYAAALRPASLKDVFIDEPNLLALNNSFERILQSKFDTKLVTFIINESEEHHIREDEVVTSKELKLVNRKFKKVFDSSILDKITVGLDYEETNGEMFSTIANYIKPVLDFINE